MAADDGGGFPVHSKSVYFAQRNPALGERFRPRWRRHAALAMSLPEVWGMVSRYSQCDPVRDPPAALGVTARYDGIGIAWFRSLDAFSAASSTEAMEVMRRDELQTFAAPVSDTSFRCTETVLKDEGPALFKVFSVLNREDGAEVCGSRRRLGGRPWRRIARRRAAQREAGETRDLRAKWRYRAARQERAPRRRVSRAVVPHPRRSV